jgi:predicted RNase H-like HicB family nuclease
MKYFVIYEKTRIGYSAYVPDLPGCITTGGSLEETKTNMRAAIGGHIEAMRLHDEPIRLPRVAK